MSVKVSSLCSGDILTLRGVKGAMLSIFTPEFSDDYYKNKFIPYLEVVGAGKYDQIKIDILQTCIHNFISGENEVIIYLKRSGRSTIPSRKQGALKPMSIIFSEVFWRGKIYRMSLHDLSKFNRL